MAFDFYNYFLMVTLDLVQMSMNINAQQQRIEYQILTKIEFKFYFRLLTIKNSLDY